MKSAKDRQMAIYEANSTTGNRMIECLSLGRRISDVTAPRGRGTRTLANIQGGSEF
jgi:hypothetical protein